MNLGELRDKLKRDHPETQGFTDAQMNAELNEGQLEIVMLTDALQNEANFNITTEESYSVSTIASDFLKIDREGGLLVKVLNDETEFDRLTYRSMETLDVLYSGWRDADSSLPHSYFLRGDNIHIYPKSKDSIANGGRLYYIQKPTAMSGDTSNPFNNLSWLYPFHKVIVLYAAMTILTSVKKYAEANAVEALYADRINVMKNFIHGEMLEDFSPDVKMGIGARQSAGRRSSRFR